jgi:CRISPR-associated exonuclease Cas4
MFEEEELLPLSALQHILFCPRQCALIHVEQIWIENRLTVEGKILHHRVDSGESTDRGRVSMEYSIFLRSLYLGLIGKADMVEFHLLENESDPAREKGKKERWLPFPVEYKWGRPKKDNCDRVQLCAQAICLEEMLNVEIQEGALFYGKTRRRESVPFDRDLRKEVEKAAARLHRLIESGETPKPVYNKKCDSCSFLELCLPKTIGKKTSPKNYLKKIIETL